jgi:hypothetical protein
MAEDELVSLSAVAALLEEEAQVCLARLVQLRELHAATLAHFGTAPDLPPDIDAIERALRAMIAPKGGA